MTNKTEWVHIRITYKQLKEWKAEYDHYLRSNDEITFSEYIRMMIDKGIKAKPSSDW